MENSEHVKKETPESPKDDHTKELSEEWDERKRTTSEEQPKAGEQLDESGPEVLEAEEKIGQLTIQSYDPNSEHIKEETPASLKNQNIKEPSEEWDEQQRATSKEQLNAGKKVDEPGSVQETKEEVIKQRIRELNEIRITIENLRSNIKSLKQERYNAKLENEKLKIEKDEKIEELQNKIDELEGALQCEKEKSKNILRNLQRNGQLCSNDCTLCCLLWICNKKLDEHPCGAHLRTLITIEAERELGRIPNINLSCKAFLCLLVEYDVLNIYPKRDFKRPEMDDNREPFYNKNKAWVELISMDEKERAVIIGSQFWDKNKLGHCWVCDLETNSRKKGQLTIYDPQHADSMLKVNKEGFISYAKKKQVDGVLVYTVNFKKLEKIIKDHEECLMHATSNDCETYYTDTNCMSRSLIPTESSDEDELSNIIDQLELQLKKKWKLQFCKRQLEKIIIKDQSMEILEKDKIVTKVAEYKYPSEEEGKLQVIDEAWDRLKTMDGNERVLILGRVISYANKKGHAELCDLDTRHDEKVKIYNPATDKKEWTNQEDFRDYVLGDDGLRLYTVNFKKLISIIEEYKDILNKY